MPMKIQVKRIYEEAEPGDGVRVLVDRWWPRGISKDKARLDDWARDIAPSNEMRKWYGHDPEKWKEFKSRYEAELKKHDDLVEALKAKANDKTLTLLYSSKEVRLNNAVALKEILEGR